MTVLQDVLATAPLFANFVEADLLALASAMRERKLTAGQLLFREGQQGDAMVLVVAGDLVVVSEEIDGQTVELARIGIGDIVGEMSALDPAPRSATVKADGPATVYVLDRTMLGAVMGNAPSVYASLLRGIGRAVTDRLERTNTRIRAEAFSHMDVPEEHIARLEEATGEFVTEPRDAASLEPLEGFTEEERKTLLVSAPLVAFHDGEILCAEGRPGYSCFIVGGGEVEILRHAADQEHQLAVLGPGSVVGQLALLHDTPRSATVRAKGDVWVVAIGRGTFQRLLSGHNSIGLKLHEQVIVAGIRQLRLASRMLTELSVAEDSPAPPPAPEPAATRELTREELMETLRKASAKVHGTPTASDRKRPLAAERARRSRQAWRAVDSGPQRPPGGNREAPKRTPTRELALYVTTALEEWGMSLDDLDDVEITVPDGQMSAAELKLRKG